MTKEDRVRRAKIAAHHLHASGGTTTEAARKALASKWEREADPAGELSPAERAKRAEHLRAAFYLRLSAAGVAARRPSRS